MYIYENELSDSDIINFVKTYHRNILNSKNHRIHRFKELKKGFMLLALTLVIMKSIFQN
jgi:hypothetical protein